MLRYIRLNRDNSISTGLFRGLVLAYLVLELASIFLTLVFPDLLAPEIARFKQEHLAAFPRQFGKMLLMYLGLSVLEIIGLFFFYSWGPRIMAITTGLGLILLPVFGVAVDSGWNALVETLATLLHGALLALVFLTPLYRRFNR